MEEPRELSVHMALAKLAVRLLASSDSRSARVVHPDWGFGQCDKG